MHVYCRFLSLHQERDGLAQQLQETQQRLVHVQQERDECQQIIDGERGTTMVSLEEFQRRHDEAIAKAEQANLASLQEKFRCSVCNSNLTCCKTMLIGSYCRSLTR